MISRIIEWCEQNRFLVFTGVVLLTIAGVWSLRHIPLDALPDISDVQVVIHTEWPGEPPNVIEDQVTYPIVTTLLAAPHVKSVRAQTMFGDSYVFVVFEDGTDLYWARSAGHGISAADRGTVASGRSSRHRTRCHREPVGFMNTRSLIELTPRA